MVGDKGNGGDIVKCMENGKEVYRTLDSVVTKDQPIFTTKTYKTHHEALASIEKRLEQTLPYMHRHLKSFLRTFNSKRSLGGNTFWIKAKKLKQVQDENLFIYLPENCDQTPLQTVVLVTQGVKRFYYNPEHLAKIESVEDELSWMLIHEFARSYVKDSDIIRLINAYLHSEEFLIDDERKIAKQLRTFNISSSLTTRTEYDLKLAEAKATYEDILGKFAKFESQTLVDTDDMNKNQLKAFKSEVVDNKVDGVSYILLNDFHRELEIEADDEIWYAEYQKYEKLYEQLVEKLKKNISNYSVWYNSDDEWEDNDYE